MFRIAIVGRPNVGKSALLNRLVQKTVSIVHDQPGITRDRISALVERGSAAFEFVDTGGIGLFESHPSQGGFAPNEGTPVEIAKAVQMQVEIAIESADLILMVVDGLEGARPLDQEISGKLRKSGKALWLIVNKLDFPVHEVRAAEFSQLGLDPVFSVSASHGRGIDRLWKELEKAEGRRMKEEKGREPSSFAGAMADKEGEPQSPKSRIQNPESSIKAPRIAIVGRPNVGKSSLANRLLDEERVIVSEVPGTTRDSVDLPIQFQGKPYILTDTAGIRHRSKVRSSVESYSRHWAERSIKRSDMALLVLDALDGPTRQDMEIAGLVLEHQKPCIILVNKWDLNETVIKKYSRSHDPKKVGKVKRRSVPRSEYEKGLRAKMHFLDHAAVMFISALEGYHALAIWQQIEQVARARRETFSTGVLNRIFARAQERMPPPMRHGKRLKIYYATQKAGEPVPTFVLFINRRDLWVENYARYLTSKLREENPLTGCPIIFQLRERVGKATAGLSQPLPE